MKKSECLSFKTDYKTDDGAIFGVVAIKYIKTFNERRLCLNGCDLYHLLPTVEEQKNTTLIRISFSFRNNNRALMNHLRVNEENTVQF